MMKLLFDGGCIANGFPGIGRYAYRLLQAMTCLPDAPEITALLPKQPGSRFDLGSLRVHKLARNAAMFNPLSQLALGLKLRSTAYDLCHFPYILHPLGTGLPQVVTVHDLIPLSFRDEFSAGWRRWAYFLALRIALRRSRALLTPTHYVAREIRHRFGTGLPLYVTPYGVDPIFTAPGSADRVLAQLGLERGYLLTVSSHRPHKNLLFLLEVYRVACGALPDVPMLVIAGPMGPSTQQLQAAVAQWGLVRKIRFLTWVREEHLPALYHGAYLFLFPSLVEGFGFPPLEARASGCPALVSDIPALRETAGPGVILLPVNDCNSWVAAIVRLLEDPEAREAMAAGATEAAAAFTWERTARLTIRAYREALA